MKNQAIFGSGTARTGSYLLCQMLSANPEVMVASDPYMELFRSWRNAIVRHTAPAEVAASFDPKSPFDDFYFEDSRIRLLDAIRDGTLDIPFDDEEWEALRQISATRAQLQFAEGIPFLSKIRAKTYRDMFEKSREIIAEARGADRRKWIGIKESWCVDFFEPLKRAYPEAKFFIILRDPRALINSILNVQDQKLVVNTISYARHWRKYAAYALRLQDDPAFRNQFLLVRHEDILADPEGKARELCRFLEVDYHPDMINTEKYIDYGTGKVWEGNSSFEDRTSGIKTHRGTRWRKTLLPEVAAAVDFICGPEMRALGYEPDHKALTPESFDRLTRENTMHSKWRSDFRSAEKDIGYELFRRALLAQPDPVEPAMARRSFLFEEVYCKLRASRPVAA